MTDLLNVPREIEFEGIKYELREPTIEEEGRFSVWLESQAREAIARDVSKNEAERAAADDRLTRSIAAGVYEFGGIVCVEALQSYHGCAKLIAIILKIDDDLSLRMFKAKAMEFAQLLGRAAHEGDPKAAEEFLRRHGFPSAFLSSSFVIDTAPKPSRASRRSRGGKSSKSGRRSKKTNKAT